jgi:uncharacterized membrane protein YgaE (UPF0421/DUF939 family)
MAGGKDGGSGGNGWSARVWSWTDVRLDQLRREPTVALRDRWRRARSFLLLALQSSIAAALSWYIANDLLHHSEPVFAPIAAIITLDISVGQRMRRAIELVLGVALGITVGDSLIYLIGTGAWQLGAVVLLATLSAVFFGGAAGVVAQAASSAVLIATLVPPTTGIYYVRLYDALIGGGIALLVMTLLLPTNPLQVVARSASPALGVLVNGLSETAAALSTRDSGRVDAALTQMIKGETELAKFREVLPETRETVTIAPLQWGKRGALAQYVEAADYVERALRGARVLVRRAVTMLTDQEPIPDKLPASLNTLADAARHLDQELTHGVPIRRCPELALQAVGEAAEAYRQGLGFSGSVVVAQTRAIATDLLGTTGRSHQEANQMIRDAGGNPAAR